MGEAFLEDGSGAVEVLSACPLPLSPAKNLLFPTPSRGCGAGNACVLGWTHGADQLLPTVIGLR